MHRLRHLRSRRPVSGGDERRSLPPARLGPVAAARRLAEMKLDWEMDPAPEPVEPRIDQRRDRAAIRRSLRQAAVGWSSVGPAAANRPTRRPPRPIEDSADAPTCWRLGDFTATASTRRARINYTSGTGSVAWYFTDVARLGDGGACSGRVRRLPVDCSYCGERVTGFSCD